MRDSERYYQIKLQIEAVDKEIAYCGRQLIKLHSYFTKVFPLSFGKRGWWLNLQKCSGEKAKTCRNCPHNLVWVFYRYIPVDKINTAKVIKTNKQLYKLLWEPDSRSEKLPWDYYITVYGKKINVGFRRRSPEMREIGRKVQKIRDRIMARRTSLMELRQIYESKLQELTKTSDKFKNDMRAEFNELDTLSRTYRRKRGEDV